jgi:arsenite methyltransferase
MTGLVQSLSQWTLENSRNLLDAAEGTLRPGGLRLTEQALDLCDLAPGSRILDAGCGSAATTRHLARVHKMSAIGLDRSPSLLGAARHQDRVLPLICAELENLPFTDHSFDGVICECVLSQTRAAEVLSELGRVLRPGGLLIISDLYRQKVSAPDDLGQAGADSLATKGQTLNLLDAAQFEVTHWQDRTGDLKNLAVRLILAADSGQDNLQHWSRQSGCSHTTETCGLRPDVGYHLLVARILAR